MPTKSPAQENDQATADASTEVQPEAAPAVERQSRPGYLERPVYVVNGKRVDPNGQPVKE